tara:strand:- start:464 stop:3133 length:2670 start_codon:yes stop_codon:yes gene_type:complete
MTPRSSNWYREIAWLEVLLLASCFTVLFAFLASFYASIFDLPVDVWRLERSIAFLSLPFFLITVRYLHTFEKPLISSLDHTVSWYLLALVFLLGFFLSFLMVKTAIDVYGSLSANKIFSAIEGIKAEVFRILAAILFLYMIRHISRLMSSLYEYRKFVIPLSFVATLFLSGHYIFKPGVINSETFENPNLVEGIISDIEEMGTPVTFVITEQEKENLEIALNRHQEKSYFKLHTPKGLNLKKVLVDKNGFVTDFEDRPSHILKNPLVYDLYEPSLRYLLTTSTAFPQDLCFLSYGLSDFYSMGKTTSPWSRYYNSDQKNIMDCIRQNVLAAIPADYDSVKSVIGSRDSVLETDGGALIIDQNRSHINAYLKTVTKFQSLAKEKPGWKSLFTTTSPLFSELSIFKSVGESTGFYAHHLNAITHTIHSSKSPISFFSNQYGFGPIMLSSYTAKAFGMSAYDGVMIATLSANLLVLGLVFILFRKMDFKVRFLTVCGCFLATAVTYFIGNFFAPFLYHIRYLPTVCLVLLLTYRFLQSGQSEKLNLASAKIDYLVLIFIPMLVIYNFEYGVLSLGGLIFAGIMQERRFAWVLPACGLLSALFLKVILGIYNDSTTPINSAGYITNIWRSGPIDIYGIFFFSALFISIYCYIKRDLIGKSFDRDAIVLITLLCSFKAVFVGSGNHIGPLFLLYSCVIVVTQTFGVTGAKNDRWGCIGGVCMLALLTTAAMAYTAGKSRLHDELRFDSYEISKVSSIQPLSSSLAKKLSDFENIYQTHDLLFSFSDSAVSLYTGKKVTEPFYDVSTNLLPGPGLESIKKFYRNSRRVIVDKLVFNDVYRQNYFSRMNPLEATGVSNPDKWKTIDLLRGLMFDLVYHSGFVKCGSSEYFDIYCKP